jgi:hypothetical protein
MARTGSVLIREAARAYIERKQKWESMFSYGENLSTKYKFTEKDINVEIEKYRSGNETGNHKGRKLV